jgi:hypothetical protein
MTGYHDSFFAYLSNKNSDDPLLPVASTRLPTPINAYENKYEFALQRLEISERWNNLVRDDYSFVLIDLSPQDMGATLGTYTIKPGYCADTVEFVDYFNEAVKDVIGLTVQPLITAKLNRRTTAGARTAFLELAAMTKIEFSNSLAKLMHLSANAFDNRQRLNPTKIPYTFDPLPGRYLNIVSQLAPLSYAFNSTANLLGTLYLPIARESVIDDRIIAANVPSPLSYVPVQLGWLDRLEVSVLDHEGNPLRLRKGCIITCVLHFRKMSASKSIAYAVQKSR